MNIFIRVICILTLLSAGNTEMLFAQNMRITKNMVGDSIMGSVDNEFLIPIHCNCKIKPDSTSARTTSFFVIPPSSTIKNVFAIHQSSIQDTSKLDFRDYIQMKCRLGDPDFKHDDRYLYLLPYPKGKSYKVVQSFKGSFTHRLAPHSMYAIDFKMPIGDTITAARDGLVFLIVQQYKEAGGKELMGKENRIFIYHSDGTIGAYLHIDHDGALVKIGDRVVAGQPIARSGHNGWSKSPHLHFAVTTPLNTSVPMKFKGYKRKKKLQKGEYYKRK